MRRLLSSKNSRKPQPDGNEHSNSEDLVAASSSSALVESIHAVAETVAEESQEEPYIVASVEPIPVHSLQRAVSEAPAQIALPLPAMARSQSGTSAPDLSNLYRSTPSTSSRGAFYPSFCDIETPQIEYTQNQQHFADPLAAAAATTRLAQQYPSGLLVQPIPRQRKQKPSGAASNNIQPVPQQSSNNVPPPLFGRRSKSNPLLEETEDISPIAVGDGYQHSRVNATNQTAQQFASPAVSRPFYPPQTNMPREISAYSRLPALDPIPSAPYNNASPREEDEEEEKTEIPAAYPSEGSSDTPPDVRAAKEPARMLIELCSQQPQIPPALLEYLDNLIQQCETAQRDLIRNITQHPESVEELFEVNEYLLSAIEKGKMVKENHAPLVRRESQTLLLQRRQSDSSSATAPSFAGTLGGNSAHSTRSDTQQQQSQTQLENDTPTVESESNTPPIDVGQLVEKRDIFSLICMLRAQQHERRLEAALALMKFAREADLVGSQENIDLRDEIRSSGGMHSLLSLFRVRETSHELKVVVALAVAYLLPSFVGLQTPPSLGLKVVDCLRLLGDTEAIRPNGQEISKEECFKAAATSLFLFWINQIEPMIEESSVGTKATDFDTHAVSFSVSRRLGAKSQAYSDGGGFFYQRRESIEMQELLEITVTLVVYLAKTGRCSRSNIEEARGSYGCTLIEQVCAIEAARPIAVREGVLSIIVDWIQSRDSERIRIAATALSHLTSIEDKYMAGWIHSQMVNEGALRGIVHLFDDNEFEMPRDVQLASAKILSSLCVAQHTRAAIIEANGIAPLIQFLCEHRDRKEGALYAGRALLQLSTGAIARATVFVDDDQEALNYASSDKQDVVIQQIIDSGAINHFIEIALSDKGNLRSVAVEIIRVLSEDTSPQRQTRGLLCRIGAAKALGVTLKDFLKVEGDVLARLRDDSNLEGDCFKYLHEAVCGLANILDPLPVTLKQQKGRKGSDDIRELLIDGCKETAESGGLESLLIIASRARIPSQGEVNLHFINLMVETCRSLASMSPLLLSDSMAAIGYSRWADDVLFAFYKVMKQITNVAGTGQGAELIREVQVNVLGGIAALACSEPLKVRVVDKLLPYLLQANSIRDGSDASSFANQTLQRLEFTDDEIAGNSPQLLADLFCLERSCMMQAMARQEIKQAVVNAWAFAFKETNDATLTHLIRERSDFSINDEPFTRRENLFENFTIDGETILLRDAVIRQYRDVYAGGESKELMRTASQDLGGTDALEESLLSRQVFPLNSSENEIQWILAHDQALRRAEQDMSYGGDISLSSHITRLLESYFPSRLLKDHVLPINDLQPRESFNFRALMMPQRRYFSFRREGQLLSRICASEEATLNGNQVHWTLGFTNSSFSGEFVESLVQALYLCPMIQGLSFSKKADSNWGSSDLGKESLSEDGGAMLANLAAALPPWISAVTFDGLLDDRDMQALVLILETMGRLSAGRESFSVQQDRSHYGATSQGRFWFFAIRRSPKIQETSWISFFNLLGRANPSASTSLTQTPLSSLKVLDLSGNQLGDDLCASVLAMAHDNESGCCLEQLDLSGNRILAGTAVLRVLTGYVNHHRYNQKTGRGSTKKGWKSPLRKLYLSNNGLHLGKAWLEIVTLLKHNALELHSLDLSSNGLVLDDFDFEFINVLVSALVRNTCLSYFDLSGNKFSHGAIDQVLNELTSVTNDSILGFLRLENNFPELSISQKELLGSISGRARKVLLQKCLNNREKNKYTDATESSMEKDRMEDDAYLMTMTEDEDSSSPPLQPDCAPGDNMITVLFSAPLVYTDDANRLCPFAKLDFSLEREHMWQCLKEASRDIELSFDTATHDRFLAAISKRCSCLHYSGHGHPDFLPFEDKGGPQWFSVQKIKDIIRRDEGASFRFVFVSACHSENAGKTFAEAGVPHVVCCRQESELKDTAALAFTRQFYLSLAVGNTVKDSFDIGCNAVRATPNLRNAETEMEKFRLLPENGNHNVPIFNAKPVYEWPRGLLVDKVSSMGRSRRRRVRGGTRASELSVRNMIQEDPSPSPSQFFLGREVELYQVLRQVLETRLVSVVGEAGIGRSSLVCALCHYINERASTMIDIERIYFVKTKQDRTSNRAHALIWRLLQKLAEADKLKDLPDEDSDIETKSETVCRILKNDKVLVVFDRVDLLEDTDEASEFPMLLSDLLRETRNVKVLLTSRHALGIPSLGEKTIELGPLNFGNSVRLFVNLCPHVHTPKARRLLRTSLVTSLEEESVLPTDPGLSDAIIRIFEVIGNGIPSKIEKAAYNMSKDDYLSLLNTYGSIRNEAILSDIQEG